MNRQKEPWRLALAIREPYLSHFVLIFVSFLVENFTDQVLCYKKGSKVGWFTAYLAKLDYIMYS